VTRILWRAGFRSRISASDSFYDFGAI